MTISSPLFTLPSSAEWAFDEIFEKEPSRAQYLECAGSPDELLLELARTFDVAFDSPGELRLGWEPAGECSSAHRAVVQCHVSSALFDWFFNARTGYRAHFRCHVDHGTQFNSTAVIAVREVLLRHLPLSIHVPIIDAGLNVIGDTVVTRDEFSRSLDPNLAKLWFGAVPLGGGDNRLVGFAPHLSVGGMPWGAPYMDDAWLDMKGAFVDEKAIYQVKDPSLRAKGLHERGSA
jgi:hypothetical protein